MKIKTCRTALCKALAVGGLWAGALSAAQAAVVTYGFDALTSLDNVTNQFAGLSFANATVLTAFDSLNEVDFPPASGANVLVDDGGPMEILFSSPVFSVGAVFTYATSLSFTIYDSGNAPLGTVVSLGASNMVGSGTGFAANELLSFSSLGGAISRVVISGDAQGFSFVMDDLTVDFGTANPVPEPVTLALVAGLLGIGVLPGGWMRRARPH